MKYFFFALIMLSATIACAQPSRHVILISIDGLRNRMYLDPEWPVPNLRQLMKEGTYADHLKSVFPSYTYPSHTAMLTGALPARSGILHNQPKGSHGEWNWFADSIRVPTLWQALKKSGLTTAAVEWPVSVHAGITYDIPEIWSTDHEGDRIGEARKYATPGLIAEIEENATGILDSNTMSEDYLYLDEQSARMAGYIFMKYKPALLAVHFACVDGAEHEFGINHDSVTLAVAANDHAVGDILEAIRRSGLQDSTTVIIVGDHGFVTIDQVFRPNILIKDIPARFIASGGSAFLYLAPESTTTKINIEKSKNKRGSDQSAKQAEIDAVIQAVTKKLDALPEEKRKLFRIINRTELDKMGGDSAAILALAARPGLVFSGSLGKAKTTNNGPGTLIQQNPMDGIFFETSGGHHGYDPDIPEMYTGFIAYGAGIKKGGRITELCETDIAPLIAELLGIDFKTPDGKLIPGILK